MIGEQPTLFDAPLAEEPPQGASGPPTVLVLPVAPLDGPLSYMDPDETLRPGDYVSAPLGGRDALGVVWDAPDDSAEAAAPVGKRRLKAISHQLDLPPMGAPMRQFLTKAAKYTLTPLGSMLRLATRAPGLTEAPPTRPGWALVQADFAAAGLRATEARSRVAQVLTSAGGAMAQAELCVAAHTTPAALKPLAAAGVIVPAPVPRDPPPPRLDPDRPGAVLTEGQQAAAQTLCKAAQTAQYQTILLEGVTGSGKTEVYLEAVAACLASGRQALILLPEIALTDDFSRRFAARFGGPPMQWHSGLGPAQRRSAWRAAASGQAQAVAGARSALFLPFARLGLIVVDEEHDQGYKQDDGALYQGRDMAVLRAACEGCAVVLATATPSLETYVNVETGRYSRAALPKRFGAAGEPILDTVDLRIDRPETGRWLAPSLVEAARHALSRGEQALFFLNRRGYAPLTMCRKCGRRFGCSQCSAWMVAHRGGGDRLMCHQCGMTQRAPEICPDCGEADHLAACGPGVERIAEEAAARFPLARLSVLSSDLSPDPLALRREISRIAAGEVDIIVGTQLVAKGHNFPNLTLAGVVDADIGLAGGDLRAAERTFQLLRQVAGRAGRAGKPGRALLQTRQPDNPVIRAILKGDGPGFLNAVAQERYQAGMPPFARLAGVVVSSTDMEETWEIARLLAEASAPLEAIGADVWGPAPAPFALLRGRHRARLLIRAPKDAPLQTALRAWRDSIKLPTQAQVVIDIDPYNFL